MLEKVKQFVKEKFDGRVIHFERTLHWLKELKPDCNEDMLIAAYAHDIERAFDRPSIEFWKDKNLDDPEYYKKHQEGGAKIMAEFLKKHNYPEDRIHQIAEMIRLHEVGGTPEADLVKDADSLSYFEVNAMDNIEQFGKPLGKKKLKTKYDFMFNRITSDQAKKIAEPMYNKAIKLLDTID